ncbi:MAG: hypothetical protein GSR72_02215 [Desulfurococcales archaeon]|nr:hypothetical protein [Desulfurococcales archaeon]
MHTRRLPSKDFIDWLRLRAPYSAYTYAKYFEKYKEELASFNIAKATTQQLG